MILSFLIIIFATTSIFNVDIDEISNNRIFLKLLLLSFLSCIVGSFIGSVAYFLLQTGQKSINSNLCIFLQIISSISIYLFILAIW